MKVLGKNKWRFTASMVQDAPDTRGVFVLWDNDTVTCVGRADGGEHTIRSGLLRHLTASRSAQAPVPTHYSWEICGDPAAREAELLGLVSEHSAEAGVVLQFGSLKRSA